MFAHRTHRIAGSVLPLLLASLPLPTHAMGSAASAADSAGGSPHSRATALPDLIAQALRDNPGLKAAAHQVRSLHAAPGHVWSLDPPRIGVEFYQAPIRSFPDPVKNQQEIDYSLQQTFPFPGKIASRIDAAHTHAQMGESDLEALERKLVREVKTDYYELYLLDRRMEINRQNQALMGRLVEITRRQYEVGLGRQADILRAQTEATNLRADSLMLDQSRRALQGMLNAFLDRPAILPLSTPDSLEPARVEWSFDQIRPLLEANHPGLKSMQAGVRMRQAEGAMALREYWPDFTLGGTYKDMLRMPEGSHGGELRDYWSVKVDMSLPIALWSLPRYKAGVAQSDAGLAQAEAEYADARNLVFARAQAALSKAQGDAELVRLTRTVLAPQAGQALQSALSAYQGGKSDFMALLDAYRMSLKAKENSETALTGLLAGQAALEEAVGLDLEEIGKRISGGAGK